MNVYNLQQYFTSKNLASERTTLQFRRKLRRSLFSTLLGSSENRWREGRNKLTLIHEQKRKKEKQFNGSRLNQRDMNREKAMLGIAAVQVNLFHKKRGKH